MNKLTWMVAGIVLSGSLSFVQAQGGEFSVPPGSTLQPYGEDDPFIADDPYYGSDAPSSVMPEVYHEGAIASCSDVSYGLCESDCACNSACDSCCVGDWRDNTEILFGGDSYASLGDFPAGGYGNSFGVVTGFNTGVALGDSRIRGQIGGTYGLYDFSGRAGGEPSHQEQQIYLTGGFSKRSDVCAGDNISWGIVYDAFFTDNWGQQSLELDMGQVRGLVGYALSECNEIGVWGTMNALNERETVTGRAPVLRAMNQANLFWRHNYEFGAESMLYIGAMDNADVGDWQIGLTARAPLSHSLSLYGNFNYVAPSTGAGGLADAEDQWNVSVGFVYFFGGKSVSPNVSGQQGLPLMSVANNGSFLVTD